MTTFLDGPAKGITLMLHRTPVFLRVTKGPRAFDALDQPDDTPHPEEALYAYTAHEYNGAVHINTGRKPGGGFFNIVSYALVVDQPTDAQMRDAKAWRTWCFANQGLVKIPFAS